MKKKKIFIITSIGAVILLILTSFTVGIGQNTINETDANSPLFAIRVQNTINREKKSVTSSYLGKGKESKISIFSSDTRVELLQKMIEKIRKMTDSQLKELVFLIYSNKNVKENPQQILRSLYQLKNKPLEIKKQISSIPNDYSHITKGCPPSIYPICSPTIDFWIPGCLLFWAIYVLSNLFFDIIDYCFTSSCTVDCTNDHGCS